MTDGSSLYWIDGAAVRTCPLAGCGAGPRTVVSGSGVAGAALLAVGGAELYLVTSSQNADVIASCPVAGCAQPTMLATAAPRATLGLAVDAQSVYYSSAGAVYSVGIAGGTPTALTPPVLATVLAVDSVAIYWAATDGVEGTPTNAIVKMGK